WKRPAPMATELTGLSPGALSPRAAVAQLRLRLRALEQEADAAEADESTAESTLDVSAAREGLHGKLERLVAQRGDARDAEGARARADAAAWIAAAHAEASAILSDLEVDEAESAYELEQPGLIAELPLFDDEWSAYLGFSPPPSLPKASRAEIARL